LIEVELENDIDFYCQSDVIPEWYYSRNGGQKNEMFFQTGYSIFMTSITLKQTGYYRCYGHNNITHQSFLAVVNVKVYGKP